MGELINKLSKAEERASKLKVSAKETIKHESQRDNERGNG